MGPGKGRVRFAKSSGDDTSSRIHVYARVTLSPCNIAQSLIEGRWERKQKKCLSKGGSKIDSVYKEVGGKGEQSRVGGRLLCRTRSTNLRETLSLLLGRIIRASEQIPTNYLFQLFVF